MNSPYAKRLEGSRKSGLDFAQTFGTVRNINYEFRKKPEHQQTNQKLEGWILIIHNSDFIIEKGVSHVHCKCKRSYD
jgi:hypothetical protein